MENRGGSAKILRGKMRNRHLGKWKRINDHGSILQLDSIIICGHESKVKISCVFFSCNIQPHRRSLALKGEEMDSTRVVVFPSETREEQGSQKYIQKRDYND